VTFSNTKNKNSGGFAGASLDYNRPNRPAKDSFVISVTSGKGGVGKTLTTVNLALSIRRMGYSVLILDGDMGLANVDVVLGLQARYNIRDVLDGQVSLQGIILDGPLGIKVIPSGSGIQSLTNLSYVQKIQIIEQIEDLDEVPDVLIIDTGAGISQSVMHLNAAADQTLVVTTPEPHAMTDAYAMIKVLGEQKHTMGQVSLVVNQTRSTKEGEGVFDRIEGVAKKFLNTKIRYAGQIPYDTQVQRAVMNRKAASEESIHTLAGQAWNQMARELIELQMAGNRSQRDPGQIWNHLLWNEQTETVRHG
jgi:flagellar biosynthesis protein FlhG